jgi:hypothetical protein
VVKYAATLALLSVAVMCGTVSYSVVTVNKHLSATLMKLDDEIDEAHRLTLEAGLTVMEARKASVREVQYLDAWNKGISQALNDLHGVMVETRSAVGSIQPVAVTTEATIRALQAPIAQANTDLAALQPVIAHTDALVSDPALTATISNVESTTGHLDATAADVQQEVHSLTHPTWLHKLWGGLLDVAHIFNPL